MAVNLKIINEESRHNLEMFLVGKMDKNKYSLDKGILIGYN